MRIMIPKNRSFPSIQRGFTLTEAAIVLALMGFFFGGIWVAAQTVSDHYKASRAIQEIGKVTQNIREFAMGTQGVQFGGNDNSGNPISTACGDITGYLDNANIFPAEMRRYCPTCSSGTGGPYNYKIDNPYNSSDTHSGTAISAGSFRVIGTSCTGASAGHFQILMLFVPPAACAKLLLSAVNYVDPSMGVTAMCAASSVAPGTGSAGNCLASPTASWTVTQQSNGVWGTSTTAPLNLSLAQTLCASASGYSEVGFEFKARN